MAKTPAQRQADYRARRPLAGAGGNGERRLNVWISTAADLALERLARRDAVTQREILQRLVIAEDDRITHALDPDSPQWQAYFGTGALRSHGAGPLRSNERERGQSPSSSLPPREH